MTTPTLMAYAPVSAAVATPERGPLVDHRFGRVYNFAIADGALNGIRWFDSYPNGNEIRARASLDTGVPTSVGPWTLCYNRQIIACNAGLSNGGFIQYLDHNDFTMVGSFGAADSSFVNNGVHIEQPHNMVSIVDQAGGGDLVICNSAFSDGVINAVHGARNYPLTSLDENACRLGALPDGSGTTAYVVGFTKLGAATQIGFYHVTNAPALVPIAKILPSQIDAAWSHIDVVDGITIDQTDGNLICAATNSTDAPTHRVYFFKLNAATGAVMWKLSTGDLVMNYGNDDMPQNLVKNGTLYYLTVAANTLMTINTVAGTATTSTISSATLDILHGGQVSEDVTGSIYWFGSWTEGSTHPNYIGTYCLTQGHTSGSSLTWRFFPSGITTPPIYGIAAQSRRRAWSFVFDGHTFYVLDLGQEGTFLYDNTTQQWSKWITQAFNGWNLTNGTQWGYRVVGGDFLTPDIWEMAPGALKDNGSVDIVHVVTGGLVKRNRVYSSVEAVRLSVSIGQLDDTAGATVQLSFSDDQGQTWTDMDAISLTEGDFSGEIAWRSLGAFAAPGRIFRITDVGGFVRIDGADVMLDNFDEDGAPAAES